MPLREMLYVWEWPVRVTHWINVICVVVLSLTGYYIHHPFIAATGTADYIMGWNRFIHFSFAYLFTLSLLVRLVWMFFGNRYAHLRAFFPWLTREGRKNFVMMARFYSFTGRRISDEPGHKATAATAYSLIYVLFIIQVVTGFALYGQYAPGGFWDRLFGPLLVIFGSQGMRLTHHLVMWVLISFAICHIYLVWLMDVKERNGSVSGMFGGYRFIEPEDR